MSTHLEKSFSEEMELALRETKPMDEDDPELPEQTVSDSSPGDGEESEDVPRKWVEKFLENRDYIEEKLESARESLFQQNRDQVFENLEKIYEYDRDIYRTLLYTTHRHEDFLQDVADQMGEEVKSELTDLWRFEKLKQQIAYTIAEKRGRKNVFTSGVIGKSVYRPEDESVITPYTVESGGTDLIKIKGDPEDHLHASALMSEAAAAGTKTAVENDLKLSRDDIDDIRSELDKIGGVIQDIGDHLDQMKVEEPEEGSTEAGGT